MAFIGNFNAHEVEPVDNSALPSGDYTALIPSSEFRQTKSGDGQYLSLAFQIVEGQYAGRYVWHNLNLMSSNPKACEIAQRELSAICRATGQMQITDSVQLHNIPMVIKVVYVPAKDQWPEKNQIKAFKPAGAAPVAAAPVAAKPAPAARPAPAAAPVAAKPAPAARPAPAAAPAQRPAPVAAPRQVPPAVAGKPWAKAPPADCSLIDSEVPF